MLLTFHSSGNRVIDTALNVTYFKRLTQGSWTGTSVVSSDVSVTYAHMHEYHRVARKSYKYVGMTLSAAQACATAMKTIYTRTVRYQKWTPTAGTMGDWEDVLATGMEMSSEIVITHVAGNGWEVVINVNEDSIYMSKTDIPRSYAIIFAVERLRSYDGETET